jgi:ribose-phosphate pyrophosphokinase
MVSNMTHLAGDVKGKTPVIIEDMIRTGGSIIECVKTLIANGAKPEIYVAATHGVFTNASFDKLNIPEIKEVIVTDTIPMPKDAPSKFKVISVAHLFAEAIRRIQNSESITDLFF